MTELRIGKDDPLPLSSKGYLSPWTYLKIPFGESQARNVLEFLFNIAYVEYFKLNRAGTLGDYKPDIEAKDFKYIREFFLILACNVDEIKFRRNFYKMVKKPTPPHWAFEYPGNQIFTTEYVAQLLLKEVEKSNNLHLHHWLNETLTNFRNLSGDSGDTGDRMVKAWEYFLKHGIQITNSEPAASVSSLRARFMAKYHPATD